MSLEQPAYDRAKGALIGLALGDALGMPGQGMKRQEVRSHYGWISDFVAPIEGHPISHGLEPAMVTDDTEQSLLLARQILASPDQFEERAWANALVAWEVEVKERGLLDLLGPSTKRALQRLQDGASPAEAGLGGRTNGAAMRICPVGIATPLDPLPEFLERVHETCRITHNSAIALAAAAAVAAAISAGISGASYEAASSLALITARKSEALALAPGEGGLALRIERAFDIVAQAAPNQAFETLVGEIGTDVDSMQSVPTALALVRLAEGEPWRVACLAANAGGDSDTIGAIATAIATACTGAAALPENRVAKLLSVNGLDLDPLVRGLLALREARWRINAGGEING